MRLSNSTNADERHRQRVERRSRLGAYASDFRRRPRRRSSLASKSDSDAKPTNIKVHSDAVTADVALDGVKSHALLDLWAFVVAHPTRPEIAANEAAFKTLLAAALASPFKFDETFALNKLAVETPQGPVTIGTGQVRRRRRWRRRRRL